MSKHYGYGYHHMGYAQYLAGYDREKYVKKVHKEKNDEHSLEKVDKQIVPDEASNDVKPTTSGAPTASAVVNEVNIDKRGREEQRLMSKSQANPISMNINKSSSNISMKISPLDNKQPY